VRPSATSFKPWPTTIRKIAGGSAPSATPQRNLAAPLGDTERQQAVEPDSGQQQRPHGKRAERHDAETLRRHQRSQPVFHRLDRLESELSIEVRDLAANRCDERTRIGSGADG